jgi:hypothetical protein
MEPGCDSKDHRYFDLKIFRAMNIRDREKKVFQPQDWWSLLKEN